MKTYRVSCLWEHWKFLHLDVQAANEKSARKKFRKRAKGSLSGVHAVEIQNPRAAVRKSTK